MNPWALMTGWLVLSLAAACIPLALAAAIAWWLNRRQP